MKILYLTHRLNTPSTRWRVQQIVPHLAAHGCSAQVTPIPKGFLAPLRLLEWVAGYDVVILQKRLMPVWYMKLLRRKCKKLVYEFDDSVMLKHEGGSARPSRVREKRFAWIVRNADAITTSTDYLASLCVPYGVREKVTVISNGIDTSHWKPVEKRRDSADVTIGWMGSGSNLIYLREVASVIGDLQKEFSRLGYTVVSDQSYSCGEARVTYKPYTVDEEVKDLQSFDIALAPLADNEWTRGKQNLKVLTYIAAGLPVVASDVAVNQFWITSGQNGLLASTSDGWKKHLTDLVRDPSLRARLGSAARRTAEENYNIVKIASQYARLYQDVCR